jgi:hypothetical protein
MPELRNAKLRVPKYSGREKGGGVKKKNNKKKKNKNIIFITFRKVRVGKKKKTNIMKRGGG